MMYLDMNRAYARRTICWQPIANNESTTCATSLTDTADHRFCPSPTYPETPFWRASSISGVIKPCFFVSSTCGRRTTETLTPRWATASPANSDARRGLGFSGLKHASVATACWPVDPIATPEVITNGFCVPASAAPMASIARWSFSQLAKEVLNPQPGSALIVQQMAYTMLIQALRLHLYDENSRKVGWLFVLADKPLSTAISCMHNDPSYPWTLQMLAEKVGMSRSTFARHFKDKVGSAPMEYLTHWRMLLACDRLKNTKDSVTQIANSLGYESESAFGKAFKRVMGCPPRQHR